MLPFFFLSSPNPVSMSIMFLQVCWSYVQHALFREALSSAAVGSGALRWEDEDLSHAARLALGDVLCMCDVCLCDREHDRIFLHLTPWVIGRAPFASEGLTVRVMVHECVCVCTGNCLDTVESCLLVLIAIDKQPHMKLHISSDSSQCFLFDGDTLLSEIVIHANAVNIMF